MRFLTPEDVAAKATRPAWVAIFSEPKLLARISPPYWLRHRAYVLSLTSNASASRNFRTICAGLCRFFRFVVIKVSWPYGHLNLHSIWISFSTAG
jgi:hypothetical protein